MVKNTAAPTTKKASKLLGQAPTPLVLKVEGTERDGQIIRVHSAKCLVGSGANCQLRLIAADVLPKHCVIYRGESGMVVKSWTRDTRINGSTISEAWLRIGDHLSLGSLSFEVLADQPSDSAPISRSSTELHQENRQQRRRSNRRIRNLLNVVRQQKTSFSSLQAKLDETQKLVDSLLAREVETPQPSQDPRQELRELQSELRKKKNQRVRNVVNHVRDLVRSNQQLQAELREQLEVKQNHLNEVRQELNTTAAETEAERSQRRLLEADLRETEATVTHLKEQASELQSRADLLRERWQSARYNGRSRVKTILSHLRNVRQHLSYLDSNDDELDSQDSEPLAELRLAYEDALRELQDHRNSLKDTESELAWSQEELTQSQQQAEELTSKIRELEEALSSTRSQQAEMAAALAATPAPPQPDPAQAEELSQLQSQLLSQTELGDQLQQQLAELQELNRELQQSITERQANEAELKQQLEESRQASLNLRQQLEESQHAATAYEEEEQSAMDHLRMMGILRDTATEEEEAWESSPGEVEEEFVEAEPPSEEAYQPETPQYEEPASQSSTGLTSFPNFKFDDEELAAEPSSSYEESPFQADSAETPTDHDPHADDKEAIDSYMQNLLQRMRAKQGVTEPAPQPVAKPASCPITPKPHVEAVEEVVTPITHEEFVPSRFAPEQTSDIRKLRELANETAKAAIDSATLNRWESLCKSKLAVSILALLAGFTLNYFSSSYLSIQFAGACLAYVVTVFWWLQSAVIYQHVKANRKERLDKRFQDEIITPHGLAVHAEAQGELPVKD